jgi:hypothetical protein
VTLCAGATGATGGGDEVDVEGGADEADEAEEDAATELDATEWCFLPRLCAGGFTAGGSFNETS